MKKILSLVLVVAMMASLVVLAPTASAADTGITVEVTDAIADQGEKVTLNIIVYTPDTFSSAQLAVDYDETRLANPVVANTAATNTPGTIAGFPYAGTTICISGAQGASQPAVEGCTIATITFDVLEDAPAGDAYVRCAPVPDEDMIFVMRTDVVNSETFDWDYVDGIVTIYPDGYTAGAPATEMPASDLEYEENAKGDGMIITGYAGDVVGGTAIIPAEIDGLPVVEIGATAFNYAEFDTYIFPSSVVTFGRRAVRQDSAFKVYIEADDASFDEKYYQSFVSNDGAVVVYSSASSSAKTYVEDVLADDDTVAISWAEGDYVAPPVVTVVAGENTSTFIVSEGANVAPAATIIDGRTTIAWKMGDTYVAPGAAVQIDGDTTFTAVTVAAPETTYGASVKATESEVALRFTAEFAKAEYDALVNAFGAENVKHGMLISTQAQIEAAGEFTHNVAKKLDFQMTGCWKIEGDNYVFAASVKNFTDKTIANNYDFNAVAYVGIDVDGDGTVDTYVYGDYDWTCARDAKTVLGNYVADLDKESDVYGWVNTWYSKFN